MGVSHERGTRVPLNLARSCRDYAENVYCVRETEIQLPRQGFSVCDHAGRVIKKFTVDKLPPQGGDFQGCGVR